MGDLFYVLFASQAFLYIIASFYFGLLITHKTYGPIYAFISYVKARTDDSKSTRGEKLRLRSGDYFKELEDLADKIDSAIDN